MAKERTEKDVAVGRTDDSREENLDPIADDAGKGKKRFVPPRVTKHGSLPKVTGQFIGTFSP